MNITLPKALATEGNWLGFMRAMCADTTSDSDRVAGLHAVTDAMITPDMLTACVNFLLQNALPVDLPDHDNIIDVCGTGGDSGIKTFNISTATAFVLAAGNAKVAKHGNRAVSSQSGSSDTLSALGVRVATTEAEAQADFIQHNLCFLSAPSFHPVLAKLGPARRSLGRPSFVNLLGPLSNPARTGRQIVGVFSSTYLRPIAMAAQQLGKKNFLVVHGNDGQDEISLCADTNFIHATPTNLREGLIHTLDFGLPQAQPQDLAGADAATNARIIRSIFSGQKGPQADAVILNAAAGFVISGIMPDYKSAAAHAREIISSGKALDKLNNFVRVQHD